MIELKLGLVIVQLLLLIAQITLGICFIDKQWAMNVSSGIAITNVLILVIVLII
ncbi:hypothetical protein [Lentilactobacillus senioris]|uniref:hypothetical protein n=1 Tax=Lentilactobacillus senioris TaxID=931534 RepID=UPI000A608CDB|nr:hypothetical protein [Lentilactobacillus senioris]